MENIELTMAGAEDSCEKLVLEVLLETCKEPGKPSKMRVAGAVRLGTRPELLGRSNFNCRRRPRLALS